MWYRQNQNTTRELRINKVEAPKAHVALKGNLSVQRRQYSNDSAGLAGLPFIEKYQSELEEPMLMGAAFSGLLLTAIQMSPSIFYELVPLLNQVTP